MEQKVITEHKVYNIIKIKGKYGFRVLLKFENEDDVIKQFSGFKTKKEAETEREKIISQLVTKTFIVSPKQLVSDFLIEWLENDIKVRTTANTYLAYKNVIKNAIIPNLKRVYLPDLTRIRIKKLYEDIYQKSKKYAELTKTIMNTSLRYAIAAGKIYENPALDVQLPKSDKALSHTLIINEKNTLNLEQICTLIEASKGSGIYLQILFATLMGLRRGEINGLKYSDIDFVHRKLYVLRQLGRETNFEEKIYQPKTKTKQEIKLKTLSSERVLDIPDFVFEEILKEREKYKKNRNRRKKEFQDLDYICCSTYGRPRSMQYHYKIFKDLLKKNDLPNIRWHDLRHSYATLLLKNDFNLKAVSKALGHSKEIVTADVYVDNIELISDGVTELKDYISEVIPRNKSNYNENEKIYDYTELNYSNVFDSYIA